MSVDTRSVDANVVSRRRDLPALTGMRFIAALMVFMSHVVFPLTPADLDPATPFRDDAINSALIDIFYSAADIGVSFFFILSGFVICWSAKPGERNTAYWRRRLVKVFPNHIVTWALTMLLFAAAFTPQWGIPNLLLVNAWYNDPAMWGGANNLTWSLNAEMLFYLLFPFLLIVVKRIAERRLWLWAGAVVALMACACLVTLWAIPDTPGVPGDPLSLSQFWFVYLFPPMRLFEFVLGMIVARIVLNGRWPRLRTTPVVALLAVGYLLTLSVPSPYRLMLVMVVPLALAIGTFAATNVRGERTVLGSRPMVWLGNVSFGVFMTQAIVLYSIRPAVFGDAEFGVFGGIVLILGLFATNVVCGWLLFTCVERPAMRRWARKPVLEPVRTPA